MKNIEVVLLNNEVVLPGQTLYGKVVCQNTDSFDVRSIKLKIVGRGKVFWIDRHLTLTTRNGRLAVRQVKTVRFRTEKYFKQEFHLLGSEEEKTKMEPGEITFDFSFTLPIEIPSSYSDRYGTIEYFAKVVVDRPWAINIKSKTFHCKKLHDIEQYTIRNGKD